MKNRINGILLSGNIFLAVAAAVATDSWTLLLLLLTLCGLSALVLFIRTTNRKSKKKLKISSYYFRDI